MRGALFFLSRINDVGMKLKIIKSSGTLKKCEEKVVSYYFAVNRNLAKALEKDFEGSWG